MTAAPTTPENLRFQILAVRGPCVLQRGYVDDDVNVVSASAREVRVLNLGPGFAWAESITLEDARGPLGFLPIADELEPGQGSVLADVKGVAAFAKHRARGKFADPYRLMIRLAVPGEILELKLVIKPFEIAGAPAPYFGVVLDQ